VADLATLTIVVNSAQVANATSTLNALGLQAQQTESKVSGFAKTFGSVEQVADRVESRMASMALRMGVHFALVTVAIGAVKGAYDMLTGEATAARESQKDLWLGLYTDIQKAEQKLNDYKSGLAGLSDAEQKGLNAVNWKRTKASGNLNDALVAQRNLPQTFNTGEGYSVGVDQGGAAREAQALVDKYKAELASIDADLAYVESERKKAKGINDTTQALKDAEAAYKRLQAQRAAFFEQQTVLDMKAEGDEAAMLNRQMDKLKIFDSMTRGIMQNRLDARSLVPLDARDEKDYYIGTAKKDYSVKDMMASKDQADPIGAGFNNLQERYDQLKQWENLMGPERFTKSLHALHMEELKLKAEDGDLWAGMAVQIESFSSRATNAFVDFTMGVKGGWRDMVSSMIKDMERYIVQQQLMGPLFGSFAEMFLPAAGPSTVANAHYTPETMGPIGGAAAAASNVSAPITVNVNQSTGAVDVKSATAAGLNLGKALTPHLQAWAANEKRPGGLLYQGN
jgi:hypothetical protein